MAKMTGTKANEFLKILKYYLAFAILTAQATTRLMCGGYGHFVLGKKVFICTAYYAAK